MSRERRQRRARRGVVRTAVLGMVLAGVGLVVPDSAVAPTEMALVKLDHAEGVDVNPDVVWILAVGSDARLGENMLRTRGDALQLIGIHTETGAATAVGIPRDSWVPIAGYGSNRVNAALYFGGPELLGETVGNLIGVQPDYVFVTRFQGLRDMVNDIGGITIRNPRFFSDDLLWPQGFDKGKIHVNGHGATAFGRIRKSLPGGDFDRSANQQRVIVGIQAQIAANADKPGFIEGGVLSVLKHLHTDLGPAELFRLAQAVAQVDPAKITGCVLQGGIGNIGGASVVIPNEADARSYGDQARDDATIENC